MRDILKYHYRLALLLLLLSSALTAQGVPRAPVLWTWNSSGPVICSGGTSWTLFGSERGHPSWGFEFLPNVTGLTYYQYSWTLGDEQGIIASGQYDTRTGGNDGSWFTASRYPIGEPNFTIVGSINASGCNAAINYTNHWPNSPFHQQIPTNFVFALQNRLSGKVIEIPGSSLQDGVVAQQNDYVAASNQKWTWGIGGSNFFGITSMLSNKGLKTGTFTDGALVFQQSPVAKVWRPVHVGNGYYRLVTCPAGSQACTIKVAGVVGGSSNNGAQIEIRNWGGGSEQQWQIVVVQ